jgi:hypothetical protein
VNDTSPEAARRLTELFSRRTPSDRVVMACEMFDLARALMVSRIKADEAGLTEEDLRVRIFEDLYAGDFDEAARARISARLRRPLGTTR